MKKGARKRRKKRFRRPLFDSANWPIIKRYMTKDGLSITVHHPAYAEGYPPQITAR